MIVDLKKALKIEIEKVAKKQIRSDTEALRKAVTRYRADIATLKREQKNFQRQLDQLRKSPAPAKQAAESSEANQRPRRFAPDWLKKHRQKLGLAAADYGKLVGVHPITIYNWEQGKSKPRAAQLEALAKVRTLGKREALRRLAD